MQSKESSTAELIKHERKIYTEWANHYLEKAAFTTFVNDLQTDLCDGILLADVIIAVTGEKLPNVKVKVKSQTQQIENINTCLIFLSNIGVLTEGIIAQDINEGNLKSILSLLFNLSRYKQQLKRQSSSASTPSAVSSNGSTLSGNNNMHKVKSRTTILKSSATGIPSLSQSPKTVTLRLTQGIVTPKRNVNNNCESSVESPLSNRGSTAKSKQPDSISNTSTLGSPSYSGIPLPSAAVVNINSKRSSLNKTTPTKSVKQSVSACNSPGTRNFSDFFVEPNQIMFDRFKLFRNSANEKINKKCNFPGLNTEDENGSTLISEPIRARSMTPYDGRLIPQYNHNVYPMAAVTQCQYPNFSNTSSEAFKQTHQSQTQAFQNYVMNPDCNIQRLVPMQIVQPQSEGNTPRLGNDSRKSRNRESDSTKKEQGSHEPSPHSINRHERQKAKELYAALKQRDRHKFNNSPQIQEQIDNSNRDAVLQKPIRMMSSQEFTQMIQNDPRLRQYVDNKNKQLLAGESNDCQNILTTNCLRKMKTELNNSPCQSQDLIEMPGVGGLQIKSNENSSEKKCIGNKPKSTIGPKSEVIQTQVTNSLPKKEPQQWAYQTTNSGTDSSDYATHYASMRKYASDFEADIDLESSVEMIAQIEKKFGYYSDSDSILNPKIGKKESGTNTDLSDLVNQKLMGLRKFMNTSGMDPAAYLAYQKNLLASKKPSSLSADKDRIYGIVLNSHIARSSAGPTPATLDDFQPHNSLSLPTQQYIRSNSARYSDFKSKDKTFPQNIKLPYATNSVNYIMKSDQGDSSQNAGSNLSLASNESCRSSAEEKQAQEIRKLRQELEIAQQKVITLSSRLSTNAHMASAFELSLMNMTERLQKLTETSEKKDQELLGLKSIIESLRQHNKRNQLSVTHVENDNGKNVTTSLGRSFSATASPAHFQLHLGHGRVSDIENNMSEYDFMSKVGLIGSSESFNSLNITNNGPDITSDHMKKQPKKGWFRSSLGKAFRKKIKTSDTSMSDAEADYYTHHSTTSNDDGQLSFMGDTSTITIENLKQQLEERDLKLTDVQLEALSSAHQLEQLKELLTAMRYEMSTLRADNERLQKMIPIEDNLNNERTSIEFSDNNTRNSNQNTVEKFNIKVDSTPQTNYSELFSNLFKFSLPGEVSIGTFVYINDWNISTTEVQQVTRRVTIGSCHISDSTSWQFLESQIKALFKEYLSFIDPFANLGINPDCIEKYNLGLTTHILPFIDEQSHTPFEIIDRRVPSSENNQIKVVIRSSNPQNSLLDALAFDTLIPKTVLQRYVSLLLEHRLIILCGPSGTGKSHLATKLAKHLIHRQGHDVTLNTLATFTVDQKSSKELKTYLSSIADQAQSWARLTINSENVDRTRKPPLVVVLDNLHHVNSLAEIFDSFLTSNVQNCPFVIGTMTQASFSNTNLQTHHNFRWVLCANHMEPVKGFLGRYLRRKLIQVEWEEKKHNEALVNTVEWISKVWQHINKFLESHSSSDVTIGPRLFLSCPMSMEGSQIWFTDLWNYSLVPYLLEAVREGLQTFGRRSKWEDPVDWILQTWPWISSTVKTRNSDPSSLIRLRPEDVGYDSHIPLNTSINSSNRMSAQNSQTITQVTNSSFMHDPRMNSLSGSITQRTSSPHNTFPRTDPLFNMLMKFQEAATYSTESSGNESEISTTKSNSLSRVQSSTSSVSQKSHIHKVFKTDIL